MYGKNRRSSVARGMRYKTNVLGILAGIAALSGCGGDDGSIPNEASSPQSISERCQALTGTAVDSITTVTSASIVSGSFTPPDGQAALTGLPEMCRVVGVIKPVPESNIKFEVWMPTVWNKKFLSSFEGGFGGAVRYPDLLADATRGYTTAGTDDGHSAADLGWMINQRERVVDFGYRAKHLQTTAAKALIKTFYGAAPAKSYFAGCSGGGREGMMELQRYPDDYDGYVIGAPANNWTGQTTYWALMNQSFVDPASVIPDGKLPAIQAATLAQCDAVDGVKDNIIADPRACTFNPDVLACTAGQDSNQCLTPPQLTALKSIYKGPRDSGGRQLFPADEIGAETYNGNWSSFITSPLGARTSLGKLTVGGMLYNRLDYDVMSFDFDRDPALLKAQLGPILDATNPDLRAQKAKGIKVIHYHGWADAALAPRESINYYERVMSSMGGLAPTQEFYKLYMIPGMVHCAGGPGPHSLGQPLSTVSATATAKDDFIKALEQWVENGIAPDVMTATKYENDDPKRAVLLKRPICPYPKVQKYVGGDPSVESSFACVSP